MFALAFVLERYTRFGRYVFAIGGAEDRAKLAGVPIDRFKVLAFTIAGFFFGVAGVLNRAASGRSRRSGKGSSLPRLPLSRSAGRRSPAALAASSKP